MKVRIFLLIYCLVIFFTVASCGFNLFSVFNPANIDSTADVNTLISMGDNYLNNLDYTNAFKAYSKAMDLSPKNSRAIEGSCTSYLFMKISVTNLILSIISSSYTINGIKNILYDVSDYIQTNLFTIINSEADGVIPYNDSSVNLNFYFFNTIYSVFYLADTDGNRNVESDTNDMIFIGDKFIPEINPYLTNTIDRATNVTKPNPFSLLMIIPLSRSINQRYSFFTNNINRSYISLKNVESTLTSDEAKKELNQLTIMMNDSLTNLTASISNLTATNSNLQMNPMNITNYFEITNANPLYIPLCFVVIQDDDSATNSLAGSGYGTNDYMSFTNDMLNSGVTNANDMTNVIIGITNMFTVMTKYFGKP